MYLLAYGRIYSNKGAMTPGATQETVDGMSLDKIGRVIDALRHERYRFSPVKRVYIPKKSGRKRRPLGLSPWSDKLVCEVVRLLLEAYYEPTFSDRSHGFRPRRGCHTALREVAHTWTGTTWFIEGDVADCFGSFDHQIMLSSLGEKIHDNRFLRLLGTMLTAGYLEDWVWNATLSGVPQGSGVSPVMSNIYLHRLDTFVETVLIPEYTRGTVRKHNPDYARVLAARVRARRRGDHATARELLKRLRTMPSMDTHDPGYRRLRYCRYADDTLLGFTGPKAEAEEIKRRLAEFLHDDLKLELSQNKTLITHARTGAARFLGYEISVGNSDTKVIAGRRRINGSIRLRVPSSVIKAKCAPYLKRGKPARRPQLLNEDDYTIVAAYGAEYGGIVQYYLPAGNVSQLTRLHWVMQTSMLKTLANKHRSSVSKMAAKHTATIDTLHGPRQCLEARIERDGRKPLVARFGGIPLRQQKKAVLTDRPTLPDVIGGKELITRLLAHRCELCRGTDGISVHHIRRLKDLDRPEASGPAWAREMTRRRRKTLVVCRTCHHDIHAGQPTAQLTS
ncbi:maturase [Actinacidiphila oryziradicis]|uniref:Maturase n=1 Tax=Actinacidiphila oryziradicis TaxID=2571141 RepID=A0A4U0RXI9_9ACTN|nr:maturase [Actinacidiphila oryziradicis]